MTLQREHGEQVALIRWWAYEANKRGIDQRLLFAIPNGGARHIFTALKLKEEGTRAGTPDLFLAVPSQANHGLFLEMKSPKATSSRKGQVSQAQNEMLKLLSEQGYLCLVAFGFEDAKNQILAYLGAPQ